jgi:type VI secretion system secreted protein VgrG
MTPDAELFLTLDIPQDVTVVRAKIVEGISKQTHARLELATTEHLVLQGVLEKDAVITMAPIGFPKRLWTLRVGHLDFIKIIGGSLRYIVNLYPAMWLLRLTTNTRKFRNMSAEQIISKILGEHGVDHRFELMRPTDSRKYCAQYRETNYDFICRLLEFEGIYYAFDDDGTVVFGDRSQDSDPTNEASEFDLIEAAGSLQWDSAGIYNFKKGRRVASGAATVNDFNWKTPKVKLLRSAATAEDSELEIYDYPTGYRKGDQGERLAQLRLDAHRVPAKYVEGSGNVTSFEPARSFVFGGMAHPRFAGDYLLTDVEHDYVNRKFEEHEEGVEEEINYRNHFSAIPKAIPFRPPLITAHPSIAGCHTATVVGPEGEEIHTDSHGRYRAQFHWDREATGTDEDSRWLRNTQELATSMVLARVGWEQSIAYIDGDPDRPFGFARNINGAMIPEYGQPNNKTRMAMKSPSYPSAGGGFNEFRMEDVAGQQHWDWHAQKDMMGQVDNDRSEHIGNDEVHKVAQSFSWSVGNNQDMTIGGDFLVKVDNAYSMNVNADRDCTVTGNEELKITEVYSYNIEGTCTEEVTGDHKVKAAEQAGSITRQVAKNWDRKVTGDWQVEGKGNLDIRAQGKLIEEVGGNKVITCENGGISYRVSGKLEMEVGASSTRESGESMGYSANNTKFDVGRAAILNTDKKIAINGTEIHLQAEDKLEFLSQALGLELTPSKTTIKGQMKLEAGSEIKFVGNVFNNTK